MKLSAAMGRICQVRIVKIPSGRSRFGKNSIGTRDSLEMMAVAGRIISFNTDKQIQNVLQGRHHKSGKGRVMYKQPESTIRKPITRISKTHGTLGQKQKDKNNHHTSSYSLK